MVGEHIHDGGYAITCVAFCIIHISIGTKFGTLYVPA
jgi:hypothetical protein